MNRIEKIDNMTKFYIGDELSLTITELENCNFIVENQFTRLEGYCKVLDNYKTEVRLDKNYKKYNNGKIRNVKKLFHHNMSWFAYILAEKGIVKTTLAM